MVSSATVSLLALTSRKNTIEGELNHNALLKTTLTREMNKVSQEYQNALNTKTLKWSNNNGVTYQDLTYSNLMTPSAMNNQQPYLITDCADRVVIASNYKKYAEMISPDGSSKGDYESHRTEILSSLVGIDPSKFDAEASADASVNDCIKVINDLDTKKAKELDPLEKKFTKSKTEDLLEKLGNSSKAGKSWKDMYTGKDKVSISDANGLQALADELKGLAKYFPDIKEETFKTRVDDSIRGFLTSINGNQDLPEGASCLYGKKGDYKVDILKFVYQVLSTCLPEKKVTNTNGYATEKVNYEWKDVDSDAYKEWKPISDQWQKDYDAAQKNYDAAMAAKGAIFTADQERKIAFYDAIFTAIAEKGWVHNTSVNDNEYLNSMLQNGSYYLTTMEKSVYADGTNADGTAKFKYEYTTGIAENDTHVYKVNDSADKDVAQAIYEDKKRIITAKETRVDNRTNNLQTELSAIQKMMESYKQIGDDNIERTMNWCG